MTPPKKKKEGFLDDLNYIDSGPLSNRRIRNRYRERPRVSGYGTSPGTPGVKLFELNYAEFVKENCVDRLHKGPPYQEGGPFELERRELIHEPVNLHLTGYADRVWQGDMIPRQWLYSPEPTFSNQLDKKSEIVLNALGTSGWAKHKPGKSGAELGQFFGELNRLPSLDIILFAARAALNLKTRAKGMTNLGNRYLDSQFGWEPFVGAIQDAHDFTTRVSAALEQLRRDNGKRVRRRGNVLHIEHPKVVDPWFGDSGALQPIIWGECYGYQSWGAARYTSQLTERAWFSAGFRYNIPDLGTPQWTKRATRALYGTRLTPDLVWELMPWSWLIDWFSNLGDVVSNLSENAAENLVADYAFIMATTTKRVSVEAQMHMKHGFQTNSQASMRQAVSHFDSTWKQRKQASPYHFGVNAADLTIRRQLILAALGISRLGW